MGKALITGGGEEGRYTIDLDFGEAQRLALFNAATEALAIIEQRVTEQQGYVDTADAIEASARAALAVTFDELVAQLQVNPTAPASARALYDSLLRDYRKLQAQHQPMRIALNALKAAKTRAQLRVRTWQDLATKSTRQAWCATFTEDAAGTVATIEVKGEPDLIVIAPGGRGHIPTIDGEVLARELMSPEQAYFNAAILPGWQKFKPTYRWGTIRSIDWDGETADIDLAPALSSAQRLDVNQASSLSAVPIFYLDCGARCFSLDERVIVRFTAQDWAAPELIGYLDTPRPCPPKFVPPLDDEGVLWNQAMTPLNISGKWTGGKEPLQYQVIEGTLPTGLSLDPDTGIISGTPTIAEQYETLRVRCSDALYVEGENRRYDDSEEFSIGVTESYSFSDGALPDGTVIEAAGTPYYRVILGGGALPPHLDDAEVRVWLYGLDEFPSTFSPGAVYWAQDYTAIGFPDIWRRITVLSGPSPTEDAVGVWLSGISGAWRWEIASGDFGTILNGDFKIEFATDSLGSNIVATVTGIFYVELLDPF
jgi:hypothetical protein